MEHNLTIRTYMVILAERDAAIQEKNMALDERRRAFAERDVAMLQRDAAIAERNSAMEERDKALAALQFREIYMNENNVSPDSPGYGIVHGARHLYRQQKMHSKAQFAEAAYNTSEIPTITPLQTTRVPSEIAKPKKVQKTKEIKETSTKNSNLSRKGKRRPESVSPLDMTTSEHLRKDDEIGGEGEYLNLQLKEWNGNVGINRVYVNESSMPVPVCSCTGAPRPCYKWGDGGWQSACCTTTMSIYPLPQISNKRHARVGGRKMTGSAFNKLLSRLVAEGRDLTAPIDLKNHWAKHGTNRYSTLK